MIVLKLNFQTYIFYLEIDKYGCYFVKGIKFKFEIMTFIWLRLLYISLFIQSFIFDHENAALLKKSS
jgi:hypothetical protein